MPQTILTEVAKLINEGVTYSAPTLSQQAGIYALQHFDEFVDPIVEVFQTRLEYVAQRVAKIPFLSLHPVKGSIYAFINIQKTGLTSVPFCGKAFKETQVLVIPGKAFGETTGDEYIRFSRNTKFRFIKGSVRSN